MALYLSSQIAPPEGKFGRNVRQCFCVTKLVKQYCAKSTYMNVVVLLSDKRKIEPNLAQIELKCGVIWGQELELQLLR